MHVRCWFFFCWLLAFCLLATVGCWLFACWLLLVVDFCLLATVGCWFLFVGCWVLFVGLLVFASWYVGRCFLSFYCCELISKKNVLNICLFNQIPKQNVPFVWLINQTQTCAKHFVGWASEKKQNVLAFYIRLINQQNNWCHFYWSIKKNLNMLICVFDWFIKIQSVLALWIN